MMLETEDRSYSYTLIFPFIASCFVVFVCYPFMLGDLNRAWDDLFHQAQQHLFADSLKRGINPFKIILTHFGIPGFASYQILHRGIAGFIEWTSGGSTTLIHNFLLVTFFAASPWTYRHFLRVVGFSRIVASVSSLLSIASVSGMGNSFEAYYEIGVISQACASVLLPLALSSFYQSLERDLGCMKPACYFTLVALAHPMYFVFAVVISVLLLLFVIKRFSVKKLFVFTVFFGILSVGWLYSFVEFRALEHSLPSSVTRPDRAIWTTSYSPTSLAKSLISGRLFDGGRRDSSFEERLDDQVNMTTTRAVRFPYLSMLVILGLLIACLQIRSNLMSFIVAGQSLSLFLYLGRDDLWFVNYVPVINQLQFFRIAYLNEFFGFALMGIAIAKLFTLLKRVGEAYIDGGLLKLVSAFFIVMLVSLFLYDTHRVVSPYMDRWSVSDFTKVVNAVAVQNSGSTDRMLVKFDKHERSRKYRYALEHLLEIKTHMRTACNHWRVLISKSTFQICSRLAHPHIYPYLTHLMGVEWLLVDKRREKGLLDFRLEGKSLFKTVENIENLRLLKNTQASFLHYGQAPRILVKANSQQWYWLVRRWLEKFGKRKTYANIPWLFRINDFSSLSVEVLNSFDAILYIDSSDIKRDHTILNVAEPKVIFANARHGVSDSIMSPNGPSWLSLLDLPSRPKSFFTFESLQVKDSPSSMRFDITASSETMVVLSMQYFPQWKAKLNGRYIPTYSAGPDLVAVLVSEGRHVLEFVYEHSWRELIAMFISFSAWLFVLTRLLLYMFKHFFPRRFFS